MIFNQLPVHYTRQSHLEPVLLYLCANNDISLFSVTEILFILLGIVIELE